MSNHSFDITILTDHRYVSPTKIDEYIQNVLDEDNSLKIALEKRGLRVTRTNWDNPTFDWSSTRYVIFRTTWDYFDRFEEFSKWLEKTASKTQFINPKELIYWNIDKHYLNDLEEAGIRIPNTLFIEQGDQRKLEDIISQLDWAEYILKPVVSGGGRHTYRFDGKNRHQHDAIYSELIQNESMMLQEFQHQILTKGEVAFMVFGGKFSHAVLKKAKTGDFRVQDDFGGSIHAYNATEEEIKFIEKAVSACQPQPVYARVDVLWNNQDQLCIGEIELIEPELWFRMDKDSANACADAILQYLK